METPTAVGWGFLVASAVGIPLWVLIRAKGGPKQRRRARRAPGDGFLAYRSRSRQEGNASTSLGVMLAFMVVAGILLVVSGAG